MRDSYVEPFGDVAYPVPNNLSESELRTKGALVCMDGDNELCIIQYIEEDDYVLVMPSNIDDVFNMSVEDALKYVNNREEFRNGVWKTC